MTQKLGCGKCRAGGRGGGGGAGGVPPPPPWTPFPPSLPPSLPSECSCSGERRGFVGGKCSGVPCFSCFCSAGSAPTDPSSESSPWAFHANRCPCSALCAACSLAGGTQANPPQTHAVAPPQAATASQRGRMEWRVTPPAARRGQGIQRGPGLDASPDFSWQRDTPGGGWRLAFMVPGKQPVPSTREGLAPEGAWRGLQTDGGGGGGSMAIILHPQPRACLHWDCHQCHTSGWGGGLPGDWYTTCLCNFSPWSAQKCKFSKLVFIIL